MKLVIDTDPGIDDSLALLIALSSTKFDVKALTVVAGNCEVDQCVRNALGLLEFVGASAVPVFRGADGPLLGRRMLAGSNVHGAEGIGHAWLPKAAVPPQSVHAAFALIDIILSNPHEIVVLSIAPLTNLALAVAIEPRIISCVRDVIIMGGALRVHGNCTAQAECNIYNDPEAAHIVFSSGMPISLVPLDATRQALVADQDIAPLFSRLRSNPIIEFCRDLTAEYFKDRPGNPGVRSAVMHDPLALSILIDPNVVEFEDFRVRVELRDGPERGLTRLVSDDPASGLGKLRAATKVDAALFLQIFLAGIERASQLI